MVLTIPHHLSGGRQLWLWPGCLVQKPAVMLSSVLKLLKSPLSVLRCMPQWSALETTRRRRIYITRFRKQRMPCKCYQFGNLKSSTRFEVWKLSITARSRFGDRRRELVRGNSNTSKPSRQFHPRVFQELSKRARRRSEQRFS